MKRIRCEAEISAPADQVFDLIADLRDQERWLPKSSSFRGTTEVSPDPVGLGTTYVERDPVGVRTGEVTEFERPTRIAFHQPMRLKAGLGVIDIVQSYTLTPQEGSTGVLREGTVSVSGPLRLLESLAARAVRKESERTLHALKLYADGLA
jgi:uncharacterized protein YndB with AHSA1/START domain